MWRRQDAVLRLLISHPDVVIGTNQLVVGPPGFVHDGDKLGGVGEQAVGFGAGQPGERLEARPVALFLQALQKFAERPDRIAGGDGTIGAVLEVTPNTADRVVGRRTLRCRRYLDVIEPAGRTLVIGIERTQRFDQIAEQLDANRLVGRWGKQVDDSAATRDLSGCADGVDAAIAQLDRLEHELVGRERGVLADRPEPRVPFRGRRQRIQQRAGRNQQQIDLAERQALQHQNPVTNDFRVRRKTAVRIGVQRRQRGDTFRVPSRQDGRSSEISAPAVEGRILGNNEQDLA